MVDRRAGDLSPDDVSRDGVLEDEQGRRWNTCYYISRVLVEYLLDVKGLTFEELMHPDVSDTETLAQLFAAHDAEALP